MNKEKLIEAKKIVMYEIGQSLEKVQNTGIDFSTKMTIAAVLGTLTATLDDKLDDIAQSEPKESDCDYWHREAIKATAKLGELRIWLESEGISLDKYLNKLNTSDSPTPTYVPSHKK